MQAGRLEIIMGNTERAIKSQRTQKQLDDLAWALDNYFKVPGINWRFGLDSLIGLIPGAGDILTGLLGLYIIFRAIQFRLPKVVITRMVINTLIDIVVGCIPILGDAFDFVWKSNAMNMKLFHHYVESPERSTRPHWFFFGALVFFFVATCILSIAMLIFLYHKWHESTLF